jgi:hypothetical protein
MVVDRNGARLLGGAGLVLLATLFVPHTSSLAPMVGVHPNNHGLYAGPEFTCADGSSKINIAQVNDNFCDCADGRSTRMAHVRVALFHVQ